MAGSSRSAAKVLFFSLLFWLSGLVFDVMTVIIGVLVALSALYHFSSKSVRKDQL